MSTAVPNVDLAGLNNGVSVFLLKISGRRFTFIPLVVRSASRNFEMDNTMESMVHRKGLMRDVVRSRYCAPTRGEAPQLEL